VVTADRDLGVVARSRDHRNALLGDASTVQDVAIAALRASLAGSAAPIARAVPSRQAARTVAR
jgi:hypothetical protein